jgi:hypothetical protein
MGCYLLEDFIRSTGESVQMVFRGEGFVVEPGEEIYSHAQPEKVVSNENVYT